MKITKYGHCCMLIEEAGVRLLIDPGNFSNLQDSVISIDIILITHEHQDHFHLESVKKVLINNSHAVIVTNSAVGRLLDKEGIKYKVTENGQSFDFKDLLLEAFGDEHATMYPGLVNVQNTGYFINKRMFYPGDAFINPGRPVDLLALPVAGPWMKLSDAIDYAKEIKPNICFPVHDGILKVPGVVHRLPGMELEKVGIKFIILELDKETEI